MIYTGPRHEVESRDSCWTGRHRTVEYGCNTPSQVGVNFTKRLKSSTGKNSQSYLSSKALFYIVSASFLQKLGAKVPPFGELTQLLAVE